MKILLAGGTGLIGSALIRSITQNGDHATFTSRFLVVLDPDLNSIPWDLDRISQEMETTDVVPGRGKYCRVQSFIHALDI